MSSGFDDFFDEEGNLISTSWKQEEEQEESLKEEQQEKLKKKRLQREMKRRIAMDNSQAEFFKEHEKRQQERAIRNEWMTMPYWIKSMPRTPMSDPPTEGRMNILKYKLTGKVELTERESNRRKKKLGRIKLAINDHKNVGRDIYYSYLNPVCVVGVGIQEGIGTSTIARCVAQGLDDSRPRSEMVLAVDYGRPGNKFTQMYSTSNDSFVFLRHAMNWLRNEDEQFDIDLIPTVSGSHSTGRLKFLGNKSDDRLRENADIDSVALLYRSMSNRTGFLITDNSLSPDELDAFRASMALANTPVFVLPISREAPDMLRNILGVVRETMGEDKYHKVLRRAVVVTTATTPELSNGEGSDMVKSFANKVVDQCGLNPERVINVPYDKALTASPVAWRKASFLTQHMVRKICGFIVDDLVEENRT